MLPSRVLTDVRSNFVNDLGDTFCTQFELLQQFSDGVGVAELVVDAHPLYGVGNPVSGNRASTDALFYQQFGYLQCLQRGRLLSRTSAENPEL